MQYLIPITVDARTVRFNTASGMDCMQYVATDRSNANVLKFQYRKRYGLHAIREIFDTVWAEAYVSIPQAVWIACNMKAYVIMENIGAVSIPQAVWIACNLITSHRSERPPARFNTASGMDCMQYRPSQPLGQLNPEAGFLNGSLFLANRRNLAGFFCRQNRLKTSANPVISRKLLSTGKI